MRGALSGQSELGCAGIQGTGAPCSARWRSGFPWLSRGVWHSPHTATLSTRYLPRATSGAAPAFSLGRCALLLGGLLFWATAGIRPSASRTRTTAAEIKASRRNIDDWNTDGRNTDGRNMDGRNMDREDIDCNLLKIALRDGAILSGRYCTLPARAASGPTLPLLSRCLSYHFIYCFHRRRCRHWRTRVSAAHELIAHVTRKHCRQRVGSDPFALRAGW